MIRDELEQQQQQLGKVCKNNSLADGFETQSHNGSCRTAQWIFRIKYEGRNTKQSQTVY